jgi:hypothetical protein
MKVQVPFGMQLFLRAAVSEKSCVPFPSVFFFPAGTLVATLNGLQAIETIKVEDEVWGYDLVASAWRPCKVRQTFRRDYYENSVFVTVAGETIESTRLHPYWVVRGEELDKRPRRNHLAKVAEGATTVGRWVDAGDLRMGDQLLLRDGRILPVEAVRQQPYEGAVFNFLVGGLNCYAVGYNGVLVHNGNGDADNGGLGQPDARSIDIQPGKGIQIGEGLSEAEAIDEVRAGGDVIAKDRDTARRIAEEAGDGAPIFEAPHGPNQHPHFHPTQGGERAGGHVLY